MYIIQSMTIERIVARKNGRLKDENSKAQQRFNERNVNEDPIFVHIHESCSYEHKSLRTDELKIIFLIISRLVPHENRRGATAKMIEIIPFPMLSQFVLYPLHSVLLSVTPM